MSVRSAPGRFSEAPLIETSRLRLRSHRPEDLGPLLDMFSEPAFNRFLGGKPLPEEEAWTKLLRNAGLWPMLGYGYWAVEEKASGKFIGEVGMADFHRTILPSLQGIPETGWILSPAVHGKGYATEAVQAVLAWEQAYVQAPQTVCIIHPDNAPSLRVAEKNGYREWQRSTYKDQPALLLSRAANSASGPLQAV